MIILRVDDVGRVPQNSPEEGTDLDLEYFQEWRAKAGLTRCPVCYGVVPQWISAKARLWLEYNILGNEELAVHGYTHGKGEEVTEDKMRTARIELCGASAYIPPYNEYTTATISSWRKAGGEYFFGGIDGEHHFYGEKPSRRHGTVHLSARRSMYGRAAEIQENLDKLEHGLDKFEFPVVMTLHVPWDIDMRSVGSLVNRIRPYLVPVSRAK